MLPREHGSWAVLIVPIALGLLAAPGARALPSALFCFGALAAFLARTPLQTLLRRPGDQKARRWTAACALMAAAGFLPLLPAYHRTWLLAFAAAALPLLAADTSARLRGKARSFLNELAGVCGLCLGAPAAFYAARGELPPEAWLLWAACAAYFAGPIFHVKLLARQHREFSVASDPAALSRARRAALAYHLCALAAALVALPEPAPLAYMAALLKTASAARLDARRVDFRRAGYQEIAFSVLFAAVMLAAFRARPLRG
ncbi:MAG: YwiC-like family protein [Elusimicrobia bacterium]|nr:YwiC-like family protein [Elusimicrobiota bacterium]MDE2425222.1 YwiC-like family protein [Elusimicrobiota bacterium]